LVSTAYHALMNRLRESARGNDRHGSCGLGIGETRHYWLRYGQDAVVARDLADRGTLLAKLALMRDRFLLEMQQLPHLDPELSSALHGLLPIDEAGMLYEAAAELELSSRMPAAETVVFEGAQGVLLDEWSGFHPFTTWSTVTPQHALELLAAVPEAETTVVGITRAYSTRHGAGPFPAFCRTMSDRMHDPGNPTNRWQGSIRFGPLDLVLAEYGARVAGVDGIFVSCLDQISSQPRMVTGYVGCDRIETPRSLRQQERITLLLQEARPIVTNATEQKILDRVETIAPIVGLSHGASPSERVLKTFEKGARCHSSLTPFQHTDRLGRPGDKPTCASIPSAQYLSGTHGAGP
jgi:adenylosuccinate synthase